jgi:hypothetical protein
MLVLELTGACAIAFWLWDARRQLHSASVVLLAMLSILIMVGSMVWYRRSTDGGPRLRQVNGRTHQKF